MNQKIKALLKPIALFMVIVMVVCMVPVAVFATDVTTDSGEESAEKGSPDSGEIPLKVSGTIRDTGPSYKLNITRTTEDGQPVPDVEYTVWKEQDSSITEIVVTDDVGEVSLHLLDPGVYFVKETETPSTCMPSEVRQQQVEITEENRTTPAVVEFSSLDVGDRILGQVDISLKVSTRSFRSSSFPDRNFQTPDEVGNGTTILPDESITFSIKVEFSDGTTSTGEIEIPASLSYGTYTFEHPTGNTQRTMVTITMMDPPEYLVQADGYVPHAKGGILYKEDYVYTPTNPTSQLYSVTPFYYSDDGRTVNNKGIRVADFDLYDSYSYLTVYAHDAEDYSKGLSGAAFEIQTGDEKTNSGTNARTIMNDVVTGSDGSVRIPLISKNADNDLVELQPPYGYQYISNDSKPYVAWDITKIAFNMTEGRLDIAFKKMDYQPGLNILVKDSEDGTPLAGATFEITPVKGSLKEYGREWDSDNPPSPGYFDAISDMPTLTGTTDADGILNFPTADVTAIEPIQESNLMAVVWDIKQIDPPDGYKASTEVKTATVRANKGMYTLVEYSNEQTSGLHIKNIAADTRDVLIGGKFKVTTDDGMDIGEFTVDETGMIKISSLPAGRYVVTQIEAANGYAVDETPHRIGIKNKKVSNLEIANEKVKGKPILDIKTLDTDTGLPLAGGNFDIVTASGNSIGTFENGDTGLIQITNLTADDYVITQVEAPSGYVLDETAHRVTLIDEQTSTIEVLNKKVKGKPILDIKTLDTDTRLPLAGGKFNIVTASGNSVGTFANGDTGLIQITNLAAGDYVITQVEAPSGYVLDESAYRVTLTDEQTSTVEVLNARTQAEVKPKSDLFIKNLDADTHEPLAGSKFQVTTATGDSVGEFVTDTTGHFKILDLSPGVYIVIQTQAPDNYILDKAPRTLTVEAEKPTTLEVFNSIMPGLRLIKKDTQTAALLSGAQFRVVSTVNGEKKDLGTFITDENGSILIPHTEPGRYIITEVEAPRGYLLDETPHEVYVEVGKLNTLEVLNTRRRSSGGGSGSGESSETAPAAPKNLEVTIVKRGATQIGAGMTFRYVHSNIQNKSSCALDEFYWRDELPTDAVRIQSLNTGTWSESGIYDLLVKTSSSDWKVISSDLSTEKEYTVDMTPSQLGLADGEYVTAYKFQFGKVGEGFTNVISPSIEVKVNENLPEGYKILGNVDVGGRNEKEWVYSSDGWSTVVSQPSKLPKTGGPDFFDVYPEYLPAKAK